MITSFRRDEVLDVLPHIISLGDDGELCPDGAFAKSRVELERIVLGSFREITKDWPVKRLVIYAHGGLVNAKGALKDIRPDLEILKRNHCYPLAIMWRTGPIKTILNQLKDDFRGLNSQRLDSLAAPRQSLGDALDSLTQAIVRNSKVQDLWGQMKENARLAAESENGGTRITCQLIAKLIEEDPSVEIHLVSHSAGSILQGYFLDYLSGDTQEGKLGVSLETCSHWAPACTIEFFKEKYLPLIDKGVIKKYSIYTLHDNDELNDRALVYNKSLLYLVSRGFEENAKIGEVPILGMEYFLNNAPDLNPLLQTSWTKVPSDQIPMCKNHGSFAEDEDILDATIKLICKSDYTAGNLDEMISLAKSETNHPKEGVESVLAEDYASQAVGSARNSDEPSPVQIMSTAKSMGVVVPKALIGRFILCVLRNLMNESLPNAIASCASKVARN
jgi:hypothetical protein